MKKPTETRIDKLKSQRRHNVQEQITLRKDQIMKSARYWRMQDLPLPLVNLMHHNEVNPRTSIFLEYDRDTDYHESLRNGSTDSGIILSEDGRFFQFDMDLNADRTQLERLNLWKDISDQYDIDGQKKGIEKTDGFIALEVLTQLNDEKIREK